MSIQSRDDLKDYCLRRLGFPVVHIEIDEDQVEDRVDDAIEFYQDIHFDGTEKIFFKVAVTEQDIENKYVVMPENIIGISKVLPFKDNLSSTNYIDYAFDPKFQLIQSEIYTVAQTSVLYYTQVQQHLAMLDHQLRALPSVKFNRRSSKCYLDFDWSIIKQGDYLVFEAFQTLDPDQFVSIFNDRLLKDYATALIKRQWGYNTKKFEGVQMIGGITISGQRIYEEAEQEIKEVEAKIRSGFELPPIGFFGD